MKDPKNSDLLPTKEKRFSVKKEETHVPGDVENRPNLTVHDPLTTDDDTYLQFMQKSPDTINTEILYFFLALAAKKGLYTRKRRHTFFAHLANILRKPYILDILFELNEIKAATVRILCERLELTQDSVYRGLKFLSSEDLVVQARPLRTKGRPATIYALKGYTPDDITEAVTREQILRTPGYTEAYRISQLILDDYFSKPEPRPPLYTRDDIYPVLRRETRGFMWRDLEGLVLTNLRRAQVTVHHGGIH